MKMLKMVALPFFICFVFFFIYQYRIGASVPFVGDMGRDLYEIAKISYGKVTLLGPKGSFGGIYTAPYFFYLFVPAFLLAGRSIIGILFFNAFLFSASLGILTYFVQKKYGSFCAIASSVILGCLPFFVMSSRQPGNGFTHIPFFIVFLAITYFTNFNKISPLKIFVLGLFLGIIFSTQFAYGVVALPILILVFLLLKKKRLFLVFISGVFSAGIPLYLFEIKNHFVMFKNTFIDKSYLLFVNNANLPNSVSLHKNIFLNSLFLDTQMSHYLLLSPLFILGIIILLSLWLPKKKERHFVLTAFLSYLFLIVALRFQYSPHYFLPFLTLLAFVFLITFLNNRLGRYILFVLSVVVLFFYPKQYYANGTPSYKTIEKRVMQTIEMKWIDNKDHFNVLLLRADDAPTPTGNEYRYFLLKNGLKTDSEFLYSSSTKLLVFSEKKSVDFETLGNWEMKQFDYKKVRQIYSFHPDSGMTVYLLQK